MCRILDLEHEVHSICFFCGQTTFKNAWVLLILESQVGRAIVSVGINKEIKFFFGGDTCSCRIVGPKLDTPYKFVNT